MGLGGGELIGCVKIIYLLSCQVSSEAGKRSIDEKVVKYLKWD
jgi:hypothetical protein